MTTNPPLSRRSTTHANDELPPWLSTKEAAFQVALWLLRQPDRALHQMRILAELAEVTGDIREALLKPPWQTRPGAHLEAAWRDQHLRCHTQNSH